MDDISGMNPQKLVIQNTNVHRIIHRIFAQLHIILSDEKKKIKPLLVIHD
jgi:hypothetical protein